MSKELARLFAKNFIARSDVKAVQIDRDAGSMHAGDWFPDVKIDPAKRPNSPHLPHGFTMDHLLAHLNGEKTYGHYLLNEQNECKLFVFDIDIEKTGSWVKLPPPEELAKMDDDAASEAMIVTYTGEDGEPLRDLWKDRRAVEARTWLKYQLKTVAHMLATRVMELDIPCAVAYSGSKGLHVYGFTGLLPAKEVKEAAMLVLDLVDEFEAVRGKNFFRHKNDDPIHGFQNLSIEVFPKQDTLDGKTMGNLVRLPLGKNWKNPKDPTFFVDMTTPLAQFKPHPDPVKLLTEGNPYV